ncbi:hypothetical protein VC83_03175 [Pseudogymnoascus destructans]|uniref:Uncharacterized protein n=1 Tax=Pseudogymnoascus destructans TaxID=655981 RepID=A0A177AFP3_9PEZI|nr:uncharacterized protein VC83_03175 [Pseudogymnoascus destructans]OAF60232.1 hypothetical protein VC83_03175 [Pseudogymnoascus destructans]
MLHLLVRPPSRNSPEHPSPPTPTCPSTQPPSTPSHTLPSSGDSIQSTASNRRLTMHPEENPIINILDILVHQKPRSLHLGSSCRFSIERINPILGRRNSN